MKKLFLRITSFILTMTFVLLMNTPVFSRAEAVIVLDKETPAAQSFLSPIVVLGGNLTTEQRATVLSIMGLTEADLVSGQYQVMYVDNATEHAYLDAYIDPTIIGKNALSSVLIRPTAKGSGIVVSSKNINYCTTGMYRNALLTAGVSDADVFVVGPIPISGTAALIGAIKGYSQVAGIAVNDKALDAALDELVTTGQIAGANGADTAHSKEIEELIAFLKAQIASGALNSEEDIRAAMKAGEEKYGISLTDKEKDQIVSVLMKIKALGLDPSKLLDQAKDLYNKFGDDLLKKPLDYVDQLTKEATSNVMSNIGAGIKNFFVGVGNKISGFFSGLFK